MPTDDDISNLVNRARRAVTKAIFLWEAQHEGRPEGELWHEFSMLDDALTPWSDDAQAE